MIYKPLTRLQCWPTSDGAAVDILAIEIFVREHGLEGKAIGIAAMTMVTDLPSTFDEQSSIKLAGYDMSREAARQVYEQSGLGLRTWM